jgi:hypothetical protein
LHFVQFHNPLRSDKTISPGFMRVCVSYILSWSISWLFMSDRN